MPCHAMNEKLGWYRLMLSCILQSTQWISLIYALSFKFIVISCCCCIRQCDCTVVYMKRSSPTQTHTYECASSVCYKIHNTLKRVCICTAAVCRCVLGDDEISTRKWNTHIEACISSIWQCMRALYSTSDRGRQATVYRTGSVSNKSNGHSISSTFYIHRYTRIECIEFVLLYNFVSKLPCSRFCFFLRNSSRLFHQYLLSAAILSDRLKCAITF